MIEVVYITKGKVHCKLYNVDGGEAETHNAKKDFLKIRTVLPDAPTRIRGTTNGREFCLAKGPDFNFDEELRLCVDADYGTRKPYMFFTRKHRKNGYKNIICKDGRIMKVQLSNCRYELLDNVRAYQFEHGIEKIKFIEEVIA